jgi:two-component system, OmpR family, sensor histidine kinase SenX3
MGIEATIASQVGDLQRGPRSFHQDRPRGRTSAPKGTAFLSSLSIIVHDLRGPLANLAILIELMEAYSRVESHDRVAVAAHKAQSLIDTLSAMLNGFLERTRETGDPLAFKPGIVDLADVVTASISLNDAIAANRGITFVRHDLDPLIVAGDKRLLIEAVDNIVGNAVKHTPDGSEVTFDISRRGEEAVIRIADNGRGFIAADLKRALRPFVSLGSGQARKANTFGLGLWIARLIAERHGGHIDVMPSGPDGGACFELALPLSLR